MSFESDGPREFITLDEARRIPRVYAFLCRVCVAFGFPPTNATLWDLLSRSDVSTSIDEWDQEWVSGPDLVANISPAGKRIAQ
jgi:hypothetical protein